MSHSLKAEKPVTDLEIRNYNPKIKYQAYYLASREANFLVGVLVFPKRTVLVDYGDYEEPRALQGADV